MAVKFFGQFLVEKGLVTREKLLEAIELQDRTNLKFGEMALTMGLINDADVERVHDAQRSEDLRFGDMTVKLGILSEEHMKQVLTRQKNNHLYIGEALVQVGALQQDQVPGLLDQFKADQAPYMVDRVEIPAGVPDAEVWEMAADLTYKMLTRVANLEFRPAPCQMVDSLPSADVVAAMDFSGSVTARYLIAVPSKVQTEIAKAILKEEDVSTEPKEVLDDTVMEFINIVCGNIAAKGAQLGRTMEISPPWLIEKPNELSVPEGQVGLLLPVHLASGGQAAVALFIGKP